MSLWADSLTVAGLACLTFGTGAQAWAFRAEFSILKAAHAKLREAEAELPVQKTLGWLGSMWALSGFDGMHGFSKERLKWWTTISVALVRGMLWSVLRWRWYARRILASGGEEAVELGRLLRQATVWAILTLGSALVLAGAVIVLIRDA